VEIKTLVRLQPDPIDVGTGTSGHAYCGKCKGVTSQYVSSVTDDLKDGEEVEDAVQAVFGGETSPVFWWRCDVCDELHGRDAGGTVTAVLIRNVWDRLPVTPVAVAEAS
jgi:hypothetical protein